MKKILLSLLTIMLAFPAMATLAVGDKFIYNGIQYEVTDADAKTCMVYPEYVEDNKHAHQEIEGDVYLAANPSYDGTTYTLTKIGDGAFLMCTGVTSVSIPNTVTTIASSAFEYCYSLTTITIGSGVTSIGTYAFSDCPITTIYYLPTTAATASENIFDTDVYNNAKFYLNPGCEDAVFAVSPWSKFRTNHISTGVENVEVADANASVEVYTLGGVKVADSINNLPAGLYIVRQGSKVSKLAVK